MTTQTQNWRTMLPLFMVIFVDVMGLCIVFPVLAPLFFDPINGLLPASINMTSRNFLYGLQLSLWPICMFISAPIIGDLSDKLGRKKVLLLCLFGEAMGYLIGAISVSTQSFFLFILSRVFAGAFAGSQPIAQAAIADISTAETKTRNMSYIVLAATLGVVLGPIIGGFMSEQRLASWFNYGTPLQIAALVSLLNAVLLIFTFHETHAIKREQVIQWLKCINLFFDAFKQKSIRNISFSFFALQVSWSLYFQILAFFLVQNYHYTTAQIGIFYTVLGIASAITLSWGIKALIKYYKRDEILYIQGGIFLAAGGLCAGIFTNEAWQYCAVILGAIGISLSYTVGLSIYSKAVGEASQGWIMGISAAIAGAAWGITAIATGPLSSISLTMPFFVVTGFSILSAVIMWHFSKQTASTAVETE